MKPTRYVVLAGLLLAVSACNGDQSGKSPEQQVLSTEAQPADTVSGTEAAGDEEGLVYVCPPCPCGHDEKTFGEPGKCSACNMDLVLKDAQAFHPQAPSRHH